MATTRNALEEVSLHVDESMGRRRSERSPQLSPVSSAKDVGRRPLRTFGAVEVDRIIPDPAQPRAEFDSEEIERLAGSIRAHGQLHPIRVRWEETAARWIIVTGERRWRAAKAAGLPAIDCFFIDGEVTEAELREQQLVENLLRTDLKPLEEAKAYQSLMDLNGWNGKQVAEALRVTTSRVSRSLALLDLPPEVQQQVDAGTLPKSSAYELSKLSDGKAQAELAAQAVAGELPHARTVKQVNQRRGKAKANPQDGVQLTFFADNGMRITISSKAKTNYHEVELGLADALEEVRHRIRNNIKIL